MSSIDSQAGIMQRDQKDQQNLKRAAWYCRPDFCICLWATLCALAILAAIIALALIPVYRQKSTSTTNQQQQQQQDSASFLLVYSVNTTNVTDLMNANRTDLANRLMTKFNLQEVTVVDTAVTTSTANNTDQCRTDMNTAAALFKILFRIKYPIDCTSTSCKQTFINQTKETIIQANDQMTLPLTSNNGSTVNVDFNMCSITQTESGNSIGGLPQTDVRTNSTEGISTGASGTDTTARSTTAIRVTTASQSTTTTRRTATQSTTTRRTATQPTTTTSRTGSTTRTTTRTASTTTRATTASTSSTTTRPTTTAVTTSTTTQTTSTTTDRPCTTTCEQQQTCVRGVCVNVGSLGMALTWSRPGDGDIVLTTPNGRTIYWGNKGPSVNTDGGNLDRDDRVGTGPENIYWQSNSTAPPVGTFHVCFQPYAFNPRLSADNPVQAMIYVRRPMNPTVTLTRIFTSTVPLTNQCAPNAASYMGTFTNP